MSTSSPHRQLRPNLYRVLVVAVLWSVLNLTPAFAAMPITLWIATKPHSPTAQQALYFTTHLRQRLPQQFNISIESEPDTVSQDYILAHVRRGKIPMAILGNTVIDHVPRLRLFRIPWLFQNQAHVQETLYAGLEDEIRTEVERKLGIVVIGVYANGFHHIRAKDAFVDPSRFKGRAMVVNGGSSLRTLLTQLHAKPRAMAVTQVAQDYASGKIDSFADRLDNLLKLPLGDTAPVITLTRHVYEPTFIVASKKFWRALTDQQRGKITDIGVDFAETALNLANAHLAAVRKNIPKGIHLKPITSDTFAEISELHRDTYLKQFGDDWLDLVDTGLDNSD